MNSKKVLVRALILVAGFGLAACSSPAPQPAPAATPAAGAAPAQAFPRFDVDVTWPKPYPNKWKIGGVTGLAVDKDDNVWVYNRPNDLTSIEIEAELEPPVDRKSVV